MQPHSDEIHPLAGVIARQRELENEIRGLRAALLETRERADTEIERLEGQVAQLQSRTGRLDYLIQSIIQSRIWRTLVVAGGIALRLQAVARAAGRGARSRRPSSTEAVFELVCDEPGFNAVSGKGLSGNVSFRGWALASSGIDRVELCAGTALAVQARGGLYRPDVFKMHPALPASERCGWQAIVDTTGLPNGRQQVIVRAVSKGGAYRQIEVPVRIDHGAGYASDYYRWIAEFEKRDARLIELKLAAFERKPLISVIVPVYRTAPAILEKTVRSVLDQSYPEWELWLVDDCSQSPELDALLECLAASDPRIRIVRLPVNGGISRASNAALDKATGEWIALLDHDDELAGDALYHIVDALNREPEADIIYSDEDHIDEAGFRSDPFFKPDWSPDLILSENYVCHLMAFRRDLCTTVGGFRSEYDLSQDHDVLLRMSRQARKIVHIPRVLYHWRTDVHSIDRASNQRERALDSSRRAVEDHVRALGWRADVVAGVVPSRWRVRYAIPGNPLVRIIMPCGGKVDLLKRCLESLDGNTDYHPYELVVVDNSRTSAVEQFVRGVKVGGRAAGYLDFRDRPFNFSAMNNAAARNCTAELLLFLNDDVTMITRDWLTAMVELACRPEVGAVGAKLLYPDGTIQHAGVVVGLLGVCGHAFKGESGNERRYFDFPDVIRNVSAVTGACMMVPTRLFWDCGGFDAVTLPVAYQDIDLCLKLSCKGYRVLYTPHAQLYHYEAVSKRPEDKDPRAAETAAFSARWKNVIEHDPFYSPNLTRSAENYAYARKRFLESV